MLQNPAPRLILASQSNSRRALLSAAGLAFECIPARIDEAAVKQAAHAEGASVDEAALLLAGLKAERVAQRHPDALVIGADQILICDGSWFDKPPDVATAAEHLHRLRGRTHSLVTAAVCQRGDSAIWSHVATPRLTMRDFSDKFLAAYLAAEGAALPSSVGAYRLEGLGVHLFDRVEGEHTAILGLPMLALLGFLRQHDLIIG